MAQDGKQKHTSNKILKKNQKTVEVKKRKPGLIIQVPESVEPPLLFDAVTHKYYPVCRVPKGFRFTKPYK